jgi:hypothetical protein
MKHTPSAIIQHLLVVEGFASAPAGRVSKWPCFITSLPDGKEAPDEALAVYDTTGILDGRLMVGNVIQHYGIMIRVRSITYTIGYLKIQAIADWFSTLRRKSIAIKDAEDLTYTLHNAKQASTIASLGPETGVSRREHFTLNLLLTVSQQ